MGIRVQNESSRLISFWLGGAVVGCQARDPEITSSTPAFGSKFQKVMSGF